MEGVSNTRLLLVVEVKNIAGPLAINIPPPPTDRLWYESAKLNFGINNIAINKPFKVTVQ